MTQFRDLDAVKGNGKLDAWRVDWRKMKPDPDNDLRDLTTKENREHIEALKNSIETEGVKEPLWVRTDDDEQIFAVDGRCRLTALAELKAEKRQYPELVLVLQEPRGTSREQRNINMLASGVFRKNLDDFEIAEGLRRQLAFQWPEKKICETMGWKTAKTIHNYLDLLALKPKLRQMVKDGKISKTEALKLAKQTNVDPGELLENAAEEHKRLHKKGDVKVKPRHVKAATKPKPPAAPAPIPASPPPMPSPAPAEAKIEPWSAPESAAAAETVSTQPPQPMPEQAAEQAQPPIRAANDPAFPPVTELSEASRTLQEHITPPAGIKDLIEALAPFARAAEQNDLNERSDDDVIEVLVGDLKRAWEVWSKATGDDVKDAA